MRAAIDIRKAEKFRGRMQTLSGVTLSVAAGERVALLGHNGAGKTTLIRMVLGLTGIDGGSIAVDGHFPGSAGARRVSAYLPESVTFHRALTGREQLGLFARLAGEPAGVVDPLLERVGLGDAAGRRIGTWSKGMRQRLGLAQVLVARPRVALLDEPTSGLDPISRRDFYRIVDEMAASGTAVLHASHTLTEIQANTDRIAILRAGYLVAEGTLAGLRAAARLPIRLRVTTRPDQAGDVADRLGGTRVNGHGVDLICAPSEKMRRLAEITALGGQVDDVEMTPPSLEDLYRHFAQGDTP